MTNEARGRRFRMRLFPQIPAKWPSGCAATEGGEAGCRRSCRVTRDSRLGKRQQETDRSSVWRRKTRFDHQRDCHRRFVGRHLHNFRNWISWRPSETMPFHNGQSKKEKNEEQSFYLRFLGRKEDTAVLVLNFLVVVKQPTSLTAQDWLDFFVEKTTTTAADGAGS